MDNYEKFDIAAKIVVVVLFVTSMFLAFGVLFAFFISDVKSLWLTRFQKMLNSKHRSASNGEFQ